VERGDVPGQPTQVRFHIDSGRHQRGKPSVVRHARHDHQPLTRLALRIGDGRNAQVHVGREALVEARLTAARLLASLAGREVEEAQVHGLPELVRAVFQEDDDAGVRLSDDRRRPGARVVHVAHL